MIPHPLPTAAETGGAGLLLAAHGIARNPDTADLDLDDIAGFMSGNRRKRSLFGITGLS